MMKRAFILFMILFVFIPVASAETTPEDILQAIDRMTPEQAHDLQKKLAKRQWDPVPGGFFDRLAVRGSFQVQALDDVDLSSLGLSSGNELDLDAMGGSEVTVLWQLFNHRFRAGFTFAALYVDDSAISAAGYSSVELTRQYAALTANHQLVRTDKFLWWAQASLGGGNLDMEVLDTPTGAASTLSKYDRDYGLAELTTGVEWRFNPELSLHLYVGYQFAQEVELDQADRETDITIDPSGVKGGLGLSYNF